MFLSVDLLTSLDIHRTPNPRTHLQIHSSQDCRQFDSPNISNYRVIYSPQRRAASQHSWIFDDVGNIYLELVA